MEVVGANDPFLLGVNYGVGIDQTQRHTSCFFVLPSPMKKASQRSERERERGREERRNLWAKLIKNGSVNQRSEFRKRL